MKKLVLSSLFLVALQGFCDCNFINGPDLLLNRMINKVKSEKKTNDIFCYSEDMKMAYYLIENDSYDLTLGVGLKLTDQTTNEEFKNRFYKKLEEYKTFFSKLDTSNLGTVPLPDKEVIRFYGLMPEENNFFIIGKYVYDLKTKTSKFYGSTTGKELFSQIGLFDRLPNVEYIDEVIF